MKQQNGAPQPSATIDPQRVADLRRREDAVFAERRPRSRALHERARRSMPNGVPMSWMVELYEHLPIFVEAGEGATFTDVDGFRYFDTNVGDMSTFCGLNPKAVVEAVTRQAQRGMQYLLPIEDAILLAEELTRRFRLTRWQFTLSATLANVEAIRLCRFATGRPAIVMFEGKYHGHAEEWLVDIKDGARVPVYPGVSLAATAQVRQLPFNDLAALDRALAPGDVACVVTEPALTNVGVIQPDPGFHTALRTLTRRRGTLLVIDEAHTLVCGPGGLTARFGLDPDVITLGKFIAGSVPLGAYGMTADLAERFARPDPGNPRRTFASGGTLFANALSMAAARATFEQVLTEVAYARTAALGSMLADGIEECCRRYGLDWRAHRLFARSGYCHGHVLPRNLTEYHATARPDLINLMRVYFANRGIWEAIGSAGPTVSIAATAADIERYLGVLDQFLAQLAS
ncbi:MAG: transaminase [Gemmatimonadales bacterium]